MSAIEVPRGNTEVIPYGSLGVTAPREQMVCRSVPGTYLPDGALCEDRLCITESVVRNRTSRNGLPGNVVAVNPDRVVWGGCVFTEFESFVAKSVSRLWPLLPGGELDGLPVVFNRPRYPAFGQMSQEPTLVNEWLAALRIREIALPEQGAVLFKRLLVPEPAWRVGAWIAPEIRYIHLHVREQMKIPPTARHDVLWLSRSKLGHCQRAYDESLLEWLLADHVACVQPEALTLAELIGLLENTRVVAGIAASAFHTLLMTREPPECFYLLRSVGPSMVGGNFGQAMLGAQHQILDAKAAFAPLLAGTMRMRRSREGGRLYPGDHRVLIPETLRAIASHILPDLLDDPRLMAIAQLSHPGSSSDPPASLDAELDTMLVKVLRDPFSFGDRLTLAVLFEDRGLHCCAAEQYAMVAALSEDRAKVRQAQAYGGQAHGE